MRKLLRKYLKGYIPYVLATFLFVGVQVVSELMLPNIMSDIVDVGIVNGDIPFVLRQGCIMLLWAIVAMMAVVVVGFCAARTTMGFGRDLRRDIFTRVEEMSVYDSSQFGASTLITRTTNDVQQIERVLFMCMTMMLFTPIMLCGAVVMAYLTDVHLANVTLSAVPFLVVGALIIMKVAMPLVRSLQKKMDGLNLVTRENLTGIRVIRAYNKQAQETQRFHQANGSLRDTNVRVGRIMAVMLPMASLILNGVVVVLCWTGAVNVQAGNLLVGNLMAVIQYATHVLISTMMLSMLFIILPRALAAAERISEVLGTVPSIQDDPDAQLPEDLVPTAQVPVAFEGVDFTFPDATEATLTDVSFTMQPGTTTVVIGPTVSGKSTVISLLQRFNDPTKGRITVGGHDIRHLPQTELRRLFSYVPQKAVLFTGTIADNIRYGKPDATDEEVREAARIAQADAFIQEKEEGYGTLVTQEGGNLSGGQKQRIAIARALVRDAILFIFDDSFSALDLKTDAALRLALKEECPHSTKLIIAQRVSQAMDADQVVVLDEGKIAGIGTHEQLMVDCPVYRDIALSQLTEEELEAQPSPGIQDDDALIPPLKGEDEGEGEGLTIFVKGHIDDEPLDDGPLHVPGRGGEEDA